jgi:hypothetical protein
MKPNKIARAKSPIQKRRIKNRGKIKVKGARGKKICLTRMLSNVYRQII